MSAPGKELQEDACQHPMSTSPFRSKATPIWLLVIINLLIIVYAAIVII